MKPTSAAFAEVPLSVWRERFRSASDAEERYRALTAIGALAEVDQAVGIIKAGLDDPDAALRAGAARWLATHAVASPRPGTADDWSMIAVRWTALLADDDPDVRFEAARGLIELDAKTPAAVTVLAELLAEDETQPAMLAAILKSYLRLDAQTPTPPWARLLMHEQSAVREAAARVLGQWGVGDAAAAPLLLPLLDDDDPFVREEAAHGLGAVGIGSAEVLAALDSATQDEDDIAAAAARLALQTLRGDSA